jgi:hypothetical protein
MPSAGSGVGGSTSTDLWGERKPTSAKESERAPYASEGDERQGSQTETGGFGSSDSRGNVRPEAVPSAAVTVPSRSCQTHVPQRPFLERRSQRYLDSRSHIFEEINCICFTRHYRRYTPVMNHSHSLCSTIPLLRPIHHHPPTPRSFSYKFAHKGPPTNNAKGTVCHYCGWLSSKRGGFAKDI